MIRRIARVLIAPAVILAAGACFATRGDVRILQGDIARLQMTAQQAAASDTARAVQLRRIIQSLTNIADSLRVATTTLQRFQGDVSMSMRSVQEQLLSVQELTGQSRKQVESLRAQLEARAAEQAQVVPPAVTPGAVPGAALGAAPAAPTAPAAPPGPYSLMDLGRQQLARGANSAARAAFSDLLTQYPTSDLAPEAQYWIAEAYASAGNAVEADSVFALVADKYPNSERAPVAIYKRAVALKVAGQTRQARTLLQQVIDKYPKSEAATLAAALLRDLR
ncbi:MAG: tol-pal system protein YbgF [Gemmatimonadaceae bacterium]